MKHFDFPVRVYYEDTDLGEVVYYANYLRFIERGRTEMLRSLGVEQLDLKAEDGIVFVVRKVDADYLRPARYDDLLTVRTTPIQTGRARLELQQDVLRGEELLFSSKVTLVCVNRDIRPVPIPKAILSAIGGHTPNG